MAFHCENAFNPDVNDTPAVGMLLHHAGGWGEDEESYAGINMGAHEKSILSQNAWARPGLMVLARFRNHARGNARQVSLGF